MKIKLFLLIFLLNFSDSFSQNLHFIVAADIADKTFGTVSTKDITTAERIFSTVAQNINYKFQPIFLVNSGFNPTTLKNTITDLPAKPTDIIVFYYSGLGISGANNSSQFPLMAFNQSPEQQLSLDEIGNLLDKKGVRLCIALADNRAEFIDILSEKWPFELTENLSKLILNKLFLESCGLLKVASTKKGTKPPPLVYKKDNSSVFMTSLDDVFTNLLTTSTHREIDEMSIETLLFNTERPLTANFFDQSQKPNWTFTPYTDSRAKLAIKSPSFANVPAIGDVEDEFNSLIKTKDVAERKEVLQAISNFFIKKSPVFVTTIKQSANDFKQRRTTIEDYLKTLTNHNPDCTVHEDFYFKEKVKKFHQNF